MQSDQLAASEHPEQIRPASSTRSAKEADGRLRSKIQVQTFEEPRSISQYVNGQMLAHSMRRIWLFADTLLPYHWSFFASFDPALCGAPAGISPTGTMQLITNLRGCLQVLSRPKHLSTPHATICHALHFVMQDSKRNVGLQTICAAHGCKGKCGL